METEAKRPGLESMLTTNSSSKVDTHLPGAKVGYIDYFSVIYLHIMSKYSLLHNFYFKMFLFLFRFIDFQHQLQLMCTVKLLFIQNRLNPLRF